MTHVDIERIKNLLLDKQSKIQELESQQEKLEFETYSEMSSLWGGMKDLDLEGEEAVKEWVFDFLYNKSLDVEELLERINL